MDIKEFKTAKRQLEMDIAQEVAKLLKDFEEGTSYTPHRVTINMVCVNTLSGTPEFVVGGATVDISL